MTVVGEAYARQGEVLMVVCGTSRSSGLVVARHARLDLGRVIPGDPQKFAQRAMITATCGLGLLDTSAMAESFGVAHSVSKLIRSLAGPPELDEEVAFGN
jgi:hypothetical protein